MRFICRILHQIILISIRLKRSIYISMIFLIKGKNGIKTLTSVENKNIFKQYLKMQMHIVVYL